MGLKFIHDAKVRREVESGGDGKGLTYEDQFHAKIMLSGVNC